MSYRSRQYNHRNAQAPEAKETPFFSKQQEPKEAQGRNPFFQTKLAINSPGDKFEQEADAAADKVVARQQPGGDKPVVQRLSTPEEKEMPATNDGRMAEDKRIQEKPAIGKAGDPEKEKPEVQRQASPKEKEEKPTVRKMELPEKKKEEGPPPVQEKSDPVKEGEKEPAAIRKKGQGAAPSASPQVASRLKDRAGKGRPLPPQIASEMSASFGVDLSSVRVHDDAEAAQLCNDLKAQAFTHGRDIYFNAGEFQPDVAAGKQLLAHELTHVVQQNGEKPAAETK